MINIIQKINNGDFDKNKIEYFYFKQEENMKNPFIQLLINFLY